MIQLAVEYNNSKHKIVSQVIAFLNWEKKKYNYKIRLLNGEIKFKKDKANGNNLNLWKLNLIIIEINVRNLKKQIKSINNNITH